MKSIFTIHKANTVSTTYANILSLGMNQITNSNSQKSKEINPKLKGIQSLVAWTVAPGVILATVAYFPYDLYLLTVK